MVDVKPIFSVSQVQTWLTCKYRWYVQYILGIRPRFDRPYIALGTAVHKGLATALVGEGPSRGIEEWQSEISEKDLNAEEEEMVDDIVDKAHEITRRTLTYIDLGHRWETVEFEGKPLVEHYFELPIGNGCTFRGYIDWVPREIATGYVWLWDHKVRGSFQSESAEEYNFQMGTYQAVLDRLGIVAGGSISFQIKSAAGKKPKVNKNGSVSKAAILTNWETYSAVVKEQGLAINDYLDMKQKLDDVEWFRLTRASRSAVETDTIFSTAIECSTDLMVEREPRQFVRNLGFMTCMGCKVRDYCLADMRGHDTEFLLKTAFTTRDSKPNNQPPQQDIGDEDEFVATI